MKKNSLKKYSYYEAVGRRKTATCRLRLHPLKKGESAEIFVNEKSIKDYFPGKLNEISYQRPFRVTNTAKRFRVTAKIIGAGINAQIGAFVHAASRALVKVDKENFQPVLRKLGFLTRDSRMKERRKPGLAQKARAAKQSPKR